MTSIQGKQLRIKITGFVLSFIAIIFLLPLQKSSGNLSNDFLLLWETDLLFASHIFSTIVSVSILSHIVKNLHKDSNNNSEKVAKFSNFGQRIFITIIVVLGLLLIGFRLHHVGILKFDLSENYQSFIIPLRTIFYWLFYVNTAFIILFFFRLDFLVYKNKSFPNLDDKNWKFINKYNWAVIISFIVILVFGYYTKTNISPVLASGLTSGAAAFQLIFAHLFFDLDYYDIKN